MKSTVWVAENGFHLKLGQDPRVTVESDVTEALRVRIANRTKEVTRAADAVRAIGAAHERLGCLDALINIAGMFRWQTVAEGDTETGDLLYAINVKTPVNCARATLVHMPRNTVDRRIIIVGANAAAKSGAGMGPYAASKPGVHRLTESLAEELQEIGIAVNAVLPSIIDTPANRADMPQPIFPSG
jgi:NAD(P)-dependent dehydrogenase (short-subunit alcohol dehydrogenase family)